MYQSFGGGGFERCALYRCPHQGCFLHHAFICQQCAGGHQRLSGKGRANRRQRNCQRGRTDRRTVANGVGKGLLTQRGSRLTGFQGVGVSALSVDHQVAILADNRGIAGGGNRHAVDVADYCACRCYIDAAAGVARPGNHVTVDRLDLRLIGVGDVVAGFQSRRGERRDQTVRFQQEQVVPGTQRKGIGIRSCQQRGLNPVIEELILNVLPGGGVVFVDIEVERRADI